MIKGDKMKFIEFEYIKQQKIWGTEDWIISAHQIGASTVKNTDGDLSRFYLKNRHLFGENLPEEFPLLVKIIDTKDDLSIQVHPGDDYAMKQENSLGKTECWYILDANDTDIIAGQKKATREAFSSKIKNNQTLDLLDIKPINKGDFFFIPAGCVHAIRKNTKLLEIQQSSDITYRLYDYERRDNQGNLRELHIEKSLDVIDYNYDNQNQPIKQIDCNNVEYLNLCTSKYFYVDLYEGIEKLSVSAPKQFKMIIAIDAPMLVDNQLIKENEGIILLADKSVEIETKGKVVVSGISRN